MPASRKPSTRAGYHGAGFCIQDCTALAQAHCLFMHTVLHRCSSSAWLSHEVTQQPEEPELLALSSELLVLWATAQLTDLGAVQDLNTKL